MGLFNKARCEFFLNDYDALKQTVVQYQNAMNCSRANAKTKATFEKFNEVLQLLVALADGENEKIAQAAATAQAWNKSKATECFVNYLKGVAACRLDNKNEALYRLMWVKDHGSKTVFATLADTYLEKL